MGIVDMVLEGETKGIEAALNAARALVGHVRIEENAYRIGALTLLTVTGTIFAAAASKAFPVVQQRAEATDYLGAAVMGFIGLAGGILAAGSFAGAAYAAYSSYVRHG